MVTQRWPAGHAEGPSPQRTSQDANSGPRGPAMPKYFTQVSPGPHGASLHDLPWPTGAPAGDAVGDDVGAAVGGGGGPDPAGFHQMHWPSTHPHEAPCVGQPSAGASHVEPTSFAAEQISEEHPPTLHCASLEHPLGCDVPSTRPWSGCLASTAPMRAPRGGGVVPGPVAVAVGWGSAAVGAAVRGGGAAVGPLAVEPSLGGDDAQATAPTLIRMDARSLCMGCLRGRAARRAESRRCRAHRGW